MLRFVRIWLPVIVTVAGVVVIVVGDFSEIALEGGAGIIGAGLSIWLMNVLFRVGLDNDKDRDEEDAARDYFDAHGHWPDEAPAPRPAPPVAEPSPAAPPAAAAP
ncbi:MAG: hypothetical protein JWO90_1996, partial [Solirubrobacterales bacterium]|nr:hypothetical protein [Solirubrobacterales bacterium]